MKRGIKAIPNNSLRRERELRGWSQQTVAMQIGVDRYYISRWERGVVSPSAYYRVRLCALFGKNVQELGLLPAELELPPDQQPPAVPVVSLQTSWWFVPHRRNPYFTGRQSLLDVLFERLHRVETAHLRLPVALCGLSGIGKTQTAIEYAYRFRAQYQAVLWIRATTSETLMIHCQQAAAFLHLPMQGVQDQRQGMIALREWLGSTQGWLLILDSIEEISLLDDLLPAEYVGQVLLTSKTQVLGRLAEPLNLEVLSQEEGMLLLLRRARIIDLNQTLSVLSASMHTNASAIVEEMGGLPLALDQAGAYIDETKCSVVQYLTCYRQSGTTLLRLRGTSDADSTEPIMTSLTLSIDSVDQTHPVAGDLLRLCAFLHPDAIPVEVFMHDVIKGDRPLVADALVLDQAVKALRRFSLVDRHSESNTLTLHRLVQVVIRAGMDAEQQRVWSERAVQAVSALLPEEESLTRERQTWWQWVLPQTLACAELIAEEKITHPAAIHLLYQTGLYLFTSALYAEAERIYYQALHLCQQVLGSEHAKTGEILNDLGVLCWYQGKYSAAKPLYHQALRICEQALGQTHIIVLHIRHNQALLCYEQGDDARAEVLFGEVVHLREEALGLMHPHVAESLHQLSRVMRRQQRLDEAETLARRALAICHQSLGEDHPLMARSLTHLGKVLAAQGQVEQAVPLLTKALTIRETVLGMEHPDVAICLNALGDLYCLQAKYEQATSVLQQAWHIRNHALTVDHPLRAETLYSLARLAMAQGNDEKARQLLQQTRVLLEKTRQPGHPDLEQVLNEQIKMDSVYH